MADPATSAVLLKAAPYVATIGGTISFNRTSLELKLFRIRSFFNVSRTFDF